MIGVPGVDEGDRFCGQSTTVLVVDDDEDLRETVSSVLALQGYRVATAANGVEALAWLEQAAVAPQLAIIDLMMPAMDGFTLRSRMASNPRLSAVPVIVMTGAGVLAEQRAEELRAPVLRKPVELARLLATVRSFCAAPGRPTE